MTKEEQLFIAKLIKKLVKIEVTKQIKLINKTPIPKKKRNIRANESMDLSNRSGIMTELQDLVGYSDMDELISGKNDDGGISEMGFNSELDGPLIDAIDMNELSGPVKAAMDKMMNTDHRRVLKVMEESANNMRNTNG